MVKCPDLDEEGNICGEEISPGDNYCGGCGWEIDKRIFEPGSRMCNSFKNGIRCQNILTKKFCSKCGTKSNVTEVNPSLEKKVDANCTKQPSNAEATGGNQSLEKKLDANYSKQLSTAETAGGNQSLENTLDANYTKQPSTAETTGGNQSLEKTLDANYTKQPPTAETAGGNQRLEKTLDANYTKQPSTAETIEDSQNLQRKDDSNSTNTLSHAESIPESQQSEIVNKVSTIMEISNEPKSMTLQDRVSSPVSANMDEDATTQSTQMTEDKTPRLDSSPAQKIQDSSNETKIESDTGTNNKHESFEDKSECDKNLITTPKAQNESVCSSQGIPEDNANTADKNVEQFRDPTTPDSLYGFTKEKKIEVETQKGKESMVDSLDVTIDKNEKFKTDSQNRTEALKNTRKKDDKTSKATKKEGKSKEKVTFSAESVPKGYKSANVKMRGHISIFFHALVSKSFWSGKEELRIIFKRNGKKFMSCTSYLESEFCCADYVKTVTEAVFEEKYFDDRENLSYVYQKEKEKDFYWYERTITLDKYRKNYYDGIVRGSAHIRFYEKRYWKGYTDEELLIDAKEALKRYFPSSAKGNNDRENKGDDTLHKIDEIYGDLIKIFQQSAKDGYSLTKNLYNVRKYEC